MVFQLHVWGPAFGLPSIEPECIATIAYCQRVIPRGQWGLVSALHAAVGVAGSLPILFEDGVATADGFEDIVAYLRNHPAVADLDADLSSRQQTDKTAFIAFLQSVATPLIDLSLYVSAENYNQATSSAYTAILPWYANYTVPPKRRDLARARTAHMGLSSLDIDATADEGFAPGRGTASSEYEAAKRAAGIPTDGPPSVLRMGRGKGIGGFLGAPVYAARFKLDALSNELLEPLADLLGKKQYLLHEGRPSSLDCLAFGYLSMLYYPAVPQAWLKETIQTKFPRVASYIGALRKEFFSKEETYAPDVWSISAGNMHEKSSQILPWKPNPQTLSNKASVAAREMFGNIPLISALARRTTVVDSNSSQVSVTNQSSLPSPFVVATLLGLTAAAAVGLTSLAVHHRRSPRDGALIFWALRPSTAGLGEAGEFLSVLANQLPVGGAFAQF